MVAHIGHHEPGRRGAWQVISVMVVSGEAHDVPAIAGGHGHRYVISGEPGFLKHLLKQSRREGFLLHPLVCYA